MLDPYQLQELWPDLKVQIGIACGGVTDICCRPDTAPARAMLSLFRELSVFYEPICQVLQQNQPKRSQLPLKTTKGARDRSACAKAIWGGCDRYWRAQRHHL